MTVTKKVLSQKTEGTTTETELVQLSRPRATDLRTVTQPNQTLFERKVGDARSTILHGTITSLVGSLAYVHCSILNSMKLHVILLTQQ